MSFFDNDGDDPFEDIVKEFFGQRKVQQKQSNIIQGETDERTIDFIETSDKIYLIFELPGYLEKDIILEISKKQIKIIAKKHARENIQSYLAQKLNQGQVIQKEMPQKIDIKKYKSNFKNGILEIEFNKK